MFFFLRCQVLCSPECRNWRSPSPLQVRLEQEEGLVVGQALGLGGQHNQVACFRLRLGSFFGEFIKIEIGDFREAVYLTNLKMFMFSLLDKVHLLYIWVVV